MKLFAISAAGAILAVSLATPAVAQTPAQLAYVQPVPPAAVQSVQEHLRSAGSYNGAADGVWGPDSEAALQRFQVGHQLQVTGQLNLATATALGIDPDALLGTQQAAIQQPVPAPETLRHSSVRAIQGRLQDLGFYQGGIDGVWGQSTQNAIEQFQQNRGLQPNGQLNSPTLAAMGLAPQSLAYQ
jgi:peptidoglycan hydrolase-like protein with peptidoglycan-binding domain